MNVHTYTCSNSGLITHNVRFGEDYGGELTVAGPIETLAGWPTPAMRRAVSGNGDQMGWYIGTDEQGNIINVAQ